MGRMPLTGLAPVTSQSRSGRKRCNVGLFDKIVSKATEVGADVAREATKAAESGSVKLGIHGLQGKRQELVEKFGKVSLALYQEKQIAHSSLDEVAARLAVIDQEIGAKEAQLQAIEEKYKTQSQ